MSAGGCNKTVSDFGLCLCMPSGAHRYASVQVEGGGARPTMHGDSIPEVMPRPLLSSAAAPGVLQRLTARKPLGVILSEEGLILTNAHVVKNAAKVTVTLTDGRTFEGSVTGSDDYMDLAAVKIRP